MLKPVAYNVTLKIVVRQDPLQSRSSAELATTSSVTADERLNTSDHRLSDSDVSLLLD